MDHTSYPKDDKKKKSCSNDLKLLILQKIYSLFKKFRNRVSVELKASKSEYFHKYFDQNRTNMKLLWKGIKSITDLSASSANIISFLKDNHGTRITDPTQMANNFNDNFVNVANHITSKIPRNPKSPLSYLKSPNPETFFISPSTSDEVSSIIKSLVNGNSTGPSSISSKLLKILDPCFSPQLSLIISKSFEEGTLPDNLKIAMVMPIFKKGDTGKNSNYRLYPFYQSSARFLKSLCTSACIAFLKCMKLCLKCNLVLELDILPSMHWLAYLKKLRALLIAAMLAVEFLLTCKRPLMQSTIESYCKNWNIMVSGELPFSGSSHTCMTGKGTVCFGKWSLFKTLQHNMWSSPGFCSWPFAL